MKEFVLNIRSKFVQFILIVLMLILISCGSSVRVQYDYIEGHDFSPYKTFDFMVQPADLQVHDKPIRRVKNSVIKELEYNGFEMRFTRPDFLIAIQTSVDSKVDINAWGYTYAPYDVYHGGYSYWGVPSMGVYKYEEGTLILDIIDPKSMTLIWRGVAQRALPSRLDNDRIQQIVDEAVRRVLYYWPPE
jgi:hypothetical protein